MRFYQLHIDHYRIELKMQDMYILMNSLHVNSVCQYTDMYLQAAVC